MAEISSSERAYALVWSFNAFLFFGLANYLIGYTNETGADFYAACGLVFIGSAFYSTLQLPAMLRKHGSIFFLPPASPLEEPLVGAALTIPWWAKFWTLFGGVAVGSAQVFMKLAMNSDPVDSGPLCSVVSSDVLFVAVFCHFVWGEKLSLPQSIAVLGVFVGTTLMATGDSKVHGATIPQGDVLTGIFWAACACVGFGSSVICIRASYMGNLDGTSSFTARVLAIGVCGLVFLAISFATGGFERTMLPLSERAWVWAICIVAGIFQAWGVYGVNKALAYPITGVCIAIFGSFSIVVLVCKAIELQTLPNHQKLFGMAVSIASCASVSLLPKAAAAAEEVEEEVEKEKDEPKEEIRDLEQAHAKKIDDMFEAEVKRVRAIPTPMN